MEAIFRFMLRRTMLVTKFVVENECFQPIKSSFAVL